MYRSSVRRIIVALALGAVLLTPWAAAAEPRAATSRGQLPQVAELPLNLMKRLLYFFDQVLAKTGCSLDPNGTCTTGQASGPTGQGDSGCGIDPNGTCGK